MCICHKNWQGNDCSERICQFANAHVDSPKGDLDMDNTISGPDYLKVENSFAYPYGTTEQFPAMEDSDLNVITESAHYYMECANKGICDRTTGECSCYPGYEGVACQRASCPGYPDNTCSGHGSCKTISQIAAAYDNHYYLWDKDVTMGCYCDSGYYGADCSLRQCKFGSDPLYLDDTSSYRKATYDFYVLSTNNHTTASLTTAYDSSTVYNLFNDGGGYNDYNAQGGYWRIRFYDIHGEDWLTDKLPDGASCAQIITALEALPNDVIPAGTTKCSSIPVLNLNSTYIGTTKKWADAVFGPGNLYSTQVRYKAIQFVSFDQFAPANAGWLWNTGDLNAYKFSDSYDKNKQAALYTTQNVKTLSGFVYSISFGVSGAIKQPVIDIYTDGKRPTLVSQNNGKVLTKVATDGQQGENLDYFADHCDGVTVTINRKGNYLEGLTTAEQKLLKACLGDADGNPTNNLNDATSNTNWDVGNYLFPHIIKLVPTTAVTNDGGYLVVLVYVNSKFQLINPFEPEDLQATANWSPPNSDQTGSSTDVFEVYTTKGVLSLVSENAELVFSYGDDTFYSVRNNATNANMGTGSYDGDLSCEVGNNNAGKLQYFTADAVSSTRGSYCLNVGDIFTFLNFPSNNPEFALEIIQNPVHINLYKVQALNKQKYMHRLDDFTGVATSATNEGASTFLLNQIKTDLAANWAVAYDGQSRWAAAFHAYKFTPSEDSTYEYVAECSNRGICDTATGLCTCFTGYTGDACDQQSLVSC